jgi:hypothetical protein
MVIELLVGSAAVGAGAGAYITKKLINYYEKSVCKLSTLEKVGPYVFIVGFTTLASIMPTAGYLHTANQKKHLEEKVMIEIQNKNYEKAQEIIQKKEKHILKDKLVDKSEMKETISELSKLIEESKYSAN